MVWDEESGFIYRVLKKIIQLHKNSQVVESLRGVWSSILKMDTVGDDVDFFASGAGSMNVVQLVEEVKDRAGVAMDNQDVFLNTTFGAFSNAVVKLMRWAPMRLFRLQRVFTIFLYFTNALLKIGSSYRFQNTKILNELKLNTKLALLLLSIAPF